MKQLKLGPTISASPGGQRCRQGILGSEVRILGPGSGGQHASTRLGQLSTCRV